MLPDVFIPSLALPAFMPDYHHENLYGRLKGKVVCGIDEVGRGPLAGPVVAGVAILPLNFPRELREHVRDSKKMTEKQREDIFEPLKKHCRFAVAEATVEEIDKLNILWASMLAMKRAFEALAAQVDIALIDGNRAPEISCETVPIVQGDDKCLSIAAASILAKVHRDRFMRNLAKEFPLYGWDHNAGYATEEHIQALTKHGPTKWHRTSFTHVQLSLNLIST